MATTGDGMPAVEAQMRDAQEAPRTSPRDFDHSPSAGAQTSVSLTPSARDSGVMHYDSANSATSATSRSSHLRDNRPSRTPSHISTGAEGRSNVAEGAGEDPLTASRAISSGLTAIKGLVLRGSRRGSNGRRISDSHVMEDVLSEIRAPQVTEPAQQRSWSLTSSKRNSLTEQIQLQCAVQKSPSGKSGHDSNEKQLEPCDTQLTKVQSIASSQPEKHKRQSRGLRISCRTSERQRRSSISFSVDNTKVTIFTADGGEMTMPIIRFTSPLGIYLDRLRMLLAVWSLTVTPLRLAFGDPFDELDHIALGSLELIVDLLFLLGVILMLWTSVGRASVGFEILNFHRIIMRRLTSYLYWCDLLSCLPVLLSICAGELPLPTSTGIRRLELLKLFRVHWVFFTPPSHFETLFVSKLQVMRMFFWIIFCTNLMACLWYAVASKNGTFDLHLVEVVDPSEASHYFLALKFGVYMITGKPVAAHSDEELLVVVVSSTVGGIFFAFIYGNTTMLLSRMNIHLSKHHKHIAMIQSTLKTLNITPDLRDRITSYHHFLALHHNVNAYNLLLQGLSMNLFVELKAHLFKKFFARATFFQNAPAAFKRSLLQVMMEVTFSPGDVIIRCGDLGSEMYFVIKGKVDVLDPENRQIGSMAENQYFGEVALLISTPRLVTIRAVTYCMLALIERARFLPIIDLYPEQKLAMLESMKHYPQVAKQLQETEENENAETEETPGHTPAKQHNLQPNENESSVAVAAEDEATKHGAGSKTCSEFKSESRDHPSCSDSQSSNSETEDSKDTDAEIQASDPPVATTRTASNGHHENGEVSAPRPNGEKLSGLVPTPPPSTPVDLAVECSTKRKRSFMGIVMPNLVASMQRQGSPQRSASHESTHRSHHNPEAGTLFRSEGNYREVRSGDGKEKEKKKHGERTLRGKRAKSFNDADPDSDSPHEERDSLHCRHRQSVPILKRRTDPADGHSPEGHATLLRRHSSGSDHASKLAEKEAQAKLAEVREQLKPSSKAAFRVAAQRRISRTEGQTNGRRPSASRCSIAAMDHRSSGHVVDPMSPQTLDPDVLDTMLDRVEEMHIDIMRGFSEAESHISKRTEHRTMRRVEKQMAAPLQELTAQVKALQEEVLRLRGGSPS